MARKALQVLVLPLLFALLGAGGKTTFCAVLSMVGVQALHHDGDGASHSGSFCLESYEEECHESESVPCSESCELRLSEAPTPGLLKVPALTTAILSPVAFEVPVATVAASDNVLSAIPDPPDRGPALSALTFTGRFLI